MALFFTPLYTFSFSSSPSSSYSSSSSSVYALFSHSSSAFFFSALYFGCRVRACEVDAAALGLGAWALDLRWNRGGGSEAAPLVDPAAFAQRHAEAHW
jgi:hypothetical protein